MNKPLNATHKELMRMADELIAIANKYKVGLLCAITKENEHSISTEIIAHAIDDHMAYCAMTGFMKNERLENAVMHAAMDKMSGELPESESVIEETYEGGMH